MEVEVHVANRIQLLQKKIVSIKEKQKKNIFQGYCNQQTWISSQLFPGVGSFFLLLGV